MGTMIENAAEVQRVLDGSHIGLCVDTGHLAAAGADPGAIVAANPARVRHVHLKDVDSSLASRVVAGELAFGDAVREGMFVPLGHGDVDITGIVEALEGAGYQGWYVLEQDVMLPGEPEGEGPVHDVRQCLDYLTRSNA
jgi:inosose dehydratase